MALATSGALSIGGFAGSGLTPRRSINEELGASLTTPRSLSSAVMRSLAGVSSQPATISFSDFYGKSAGANLLDTTVTSTTAGSSAQVQAYGINFTTSNVNPIVNGLADGDTMRVTFQNSSGTQIFQFTCDVTKSTSASFPFYTSVVIDGGTITNISSTPSGASVNSSDNSKITLPSGFCSFSDGNNSTVSFAFSATQPSASTPNFVTGSNQMTFTRLTSSSSSPPSSPTNRILVDKL
jgi:hypothetical protein